MTDTVDLDDLLTNEQAAALLAIKPTTLEIWRIRGRSPPFIKLGTTKQAPIRYRRSEVMRWVSERSFASTSAYSAATPSNTISPVSRSKGASA